MQPLLSINNISCRYHDQVVVQAFNLQVEKGSIACLLGPSGCGKTTVLRAIAGFAPIASGTITLRDKVVSRPGYSLAPEKRKLGLVFQEYALFPHLNLEKNVLFGLRNHSKQQKQQRVQEMLALVGMADLGQRFPHELSGGQQQRIALARALAPQPDLILFDEPFSNLDVDLRERLGIEVQGILKQQGVTGILVTHDQHEAFAICDQIAVMREGRILQWDNAYQLYHQP